MKNILILMMLLTSATISAETLSKSQSNEIESLLAESSSKLIYLERDCGKDMDVDKFKEIAKLKAFSEGYTTLNGISWADVREQAHQDYGVLRAEAPAGELCHAYEEQIKGTYRFLKAS